MPNQQYPQYTIRASLDQSGDSLFIRIGNPLQAPIRAYLKSTDKGLQNILRTIGPVLVAPLKDTTLLLHYPGREKPLVNIQTKLGDPGEAILQNSFELPFPTGKTYRVIQGNDMLPTHNSPSSRFAIDINLQKGDTICAAEGGFVVGVVAQYKRGGAGSQWKPFGNYITLFHPVSGLFSQYVHLRYQGSLVAVGDKVNAGQPIGFAGLTGQTNIEHLHFNVLSPAENENGLISVPVVFKEGYAGKDLQKGQKLTKK